MNWLDRILVDFNGWPWNYLWRIALGAAIPEIFRAIAGGQSPIWVSLVLFGGLLVAMWLVPAVMRRLLPFSQATKQIWKERRFIAKRYDSYQWQKLFWIGLGLLTHVFFGSGLNRGEWLVALICLVGGGGGLYMWRKVAVMRPAESKPASV